jgi:hypothetical protein
MLVFIESARYNKAGQWTRKQRAHACGVMCTCRIGAGTEMVTPYLFVVFWIVCGGVAWKVATSRGGNSTVWTIIGQILGPFSIVLAYFVPFASAKSG